MKKFFMLMTAVLASSLSGLSAQASMESTAHTAVASTSWTAAFADLAGVDDIMSLLPPISSRSRMPRFSFMQDMKE